MNDLLRRSQELSNLSFSSPGSVDTLKNIIRDAKSIMRSYAFLSSRHDLHDVINSVPSQVSSADEPEFLEVKYNVIRNIKKFWATFKQIEVADRV